jgi:hypothetical protein
MPGARCARSRAWCVDSTRVSHHGHTGKRPAFPAQWFYGLFRALPGDRACLPPSSAEMASANLMPASGHQDHTTSPSASRAIRQRRISVHRIPPRVRDDREPPLQRNGMAGVLDLIWVKREAEYFCEKGWTGQPLICPSGKLSTVCASRCKSVEAGRSCMAHHSPILRATAHPNAEPRRCP